MKTMSVDQVQAALEECVPSQAQFFGDDFEVCENFLCRLKETIMKFLNDYVELPPKDVVLDAFGKLLDTLIPVLPVSSLLKRLVRRSAMITAEALYDMIAAARA
jgi:hypothetical protein